MLIKDRVVKVLEYKEVAKENFYKKIGMSSASFRGKAKETPINSNAIANILSEIPDINPEWLLTGKGSMLRSSNVKKTEQTPVNTVGSEVQNTKCKQQIQVLEQENTFLKELNNHLKENIDLLKSTIQDKNQIIQLKDKEIAELQKKQLYATGYSIASEPEVEYNKR